MLSKMRFTTVTTLFISATIVQPVLAEEFNQEKLNQVLEMEEMMLIVSSEPIVYNQDLYNTPVPIMHGTGIPGATSRRNISNSASWEYYRFCANSGDEVSIQVDRTTYDMDPALQVCQGTTTTNNGVYAFGGCGSMGPFIGGADDNNGIPHRVGGQYRDPRLTFIAPDGPTPNEFTLMVFDFISAGPNPQFEIHVSGVSPCLIPVAVDIKSGTDPNSINLCSQGAVPVAILGSDTFDVYDVNLDTLSFAGAGVKVVGKKNPRIMCGIEDTNIDGIDDLVCHFVTAELALDGTSTTATLTGEIYDGTPIEGTDSVNIVKDVCY